MASSRKREEKEERPKAERKERKAPREEESIKDVVVELIEIIGPLCTRGAKEKLVALRDRLRAK
jgi:hypothetical protein